MYLALIQVYTMPLWTKSEIIEALGDEILQQSIIDQSYDSVVIDGRKPSPNSIFIALKGENHDAHSFLDQAIGSGATLAIIDNPEFFKPGLPLVLVKYTFTALYKLAAFARKRSKAKIIAVTGSVGKTGTKEMLGLAFKTQGATYASLGNLNNHIGLPLNLANFPRDFEYGIFELGMNHKNEIAPLSDLLKPDVAIITNVGPVHIEFFKSEEEIALAKAEIFTGLGTNGIALLNQDNPHYALLRNSAAAKIKKIFSFGKSEKSDYQILSVASSDRSKITAKLKNGETLEYEIPSANPAVIFNSIIVIAALDLVGKDLKCGSKALADISFGDKRGKITQLKIDGKNITVIDDSYNASILSVAAGLEHAANLKQSSKSKRVVAVLGDMLELGESSVAIHTQVAEFLKKFKIDFALLAGNSMRHAAAALDQSIPHLHFKNSDELALAIRKIINDGDIFYIKGSRGMKMEKVTEALTHHAK